MEHWVADLTARWAVNSENDLIVHRGAEERCHEGCRMLLYADLKVVAVVDRRSAEIVPELLHF